MRFLWAALLGLATALPVDKEPSIEKGPTPAVVKEPVETSVLSAAEEPVPVTPDRGTDVPRLVLYFQTTHDALGQPISMLPLITEKNIALTHLIVCSFHINEGGNITLNDYPPWYPLFNTLWNETRLMQDAGVRVMGMVGGAAAGSFSRRTLDGNATTFEHYYGQLRDTIRAYRLEGMDLDVEQPMSQAGITRLVSRLRADFGPDFIITLSPVATALQGGGNLSGFDYQQLEHDVGRHIAFYNAQFYNGWGYAGSTSEYDTIVRTGYAPTRIVLGQVTTSDNGGDYVEPAQLNETVRLLRAEYGQIGGIMGWEYFNSAPGGTERPWEWAQIMTAILRPGLVPLLRITKDIARGLVQAWQDSLAGGGDMIATAVMPVTPTVDYFAMVNA
ncbi:chitinase 2 [Echria macrotheca]|uniref:Chitinase 2 n=1 Tax=Echria macrotheca TaxID=438768 RepID=A0AAJ0FAS0_9PEZI|nr:chitinase 2 [Echria macrotheca]